jgi:hypothetical protein
MHLENPGLTLSGKKKGKKKFASADAKHKAKSLDNDWNELMRKYESKKVVRKVFKTEKLSPNMTTPRKTVSVPSLVTPGGNCNKVAPTIYTGDKVLGIATMHKSNLVPIFSGEEAVAVSSMRR